MSAPIESYAIVGDCRTVAVVGLDGSIDWLCWPRFDSDACFAALLGTPANGRWLIRPMDPAAVVSRRYRKDTLILETSFVTGSGKATLIDFMVPRGDGPHLARLVRGDEGEVELHMPTRFAHADLTLARTRSGRPTTRRLSTPASCCSLRSGFSMVPIHGSEARWQPSSASSWATAS